MGGYRDQETNKIYVISIMAWHNTKGGMYYHPYIRSGVKPRYNMFHFFDNKGSYLHNPVTTAWEGFKGGNYATTIAQGNYMTRNFRQKYYLGTNYNKMPNYVPSGLFVAKHKYKKPSKPKPNKVATNRKNVKKAKKLSNKKALGKQIQDLRKAIKIDVAKHTFKVSDCGVLSSLIGRCNHTNFEGSTVSKIETATANLRYYDPANPGTLITADPNTGTYSRDVTIKNYHTKILFRNNYQVPVKVKVYLCKAKMDTANSPVATYTAGITDQVITAGADETDALLYLNDIERVKELWNIDCVVDKQLNPGQEAHCSHSSGSFQHDPSHVDTESDAYQKAYKAYSFVVRVEGVLGHDTGQGNEHTLLLGSVDYQIDRKCEIEYDAGVSLNDIFIDENRLQAFTNGGVVSNYPIADNQAYSMS